MIYYVAFVTNVTWKTIPNIRFRFFRQQKTASSFTTKSSHNQRVYEEFTCHRQNPGFVALDVQHQNPPDVQCRHPTLLHIQG